jgi:aminocarboxymuconate-semialdehyde decarboxylase
MAIDMHCHWTPRGLVAAAEAGRDWYGWHLFRNAKGHEYVVHGHESLPFSASRSILDDPAGRAKMRKEKEGIDLQNLVLTATFFSYFLDEARAAAYCCEINAEVAEVQKAYPDLYRGVAILPMQHPKLALQILDEAGKLGLNTILVASHVRGLNLDEPAVLPILEEAARRGMAIMVHPVIWEKAGENRFPRYNFWNSFGAPLETSLAAMSLAHSGFLDRHPEARLFFTQGGGWIHFGVGRLNLRYVQRADSRTMKHAPVDYLKMMYYDCLVHDDDSLDLLKRRAGADHIMIGTDYPAGGDILGGAVPWIEKSPLFTDEEKALVLYRNAEKFLGLKLAKVA